MLSLHPSNFATSITKSTLVFIFKFQKNENYNSKGKEGDEVHNKCDS